MLKEIISADKLGGVYDNFKFYGITVILNQVFLTLKYISMNIIQWVKWWEHSRNRY